MKQSLGCWLASLLILVGAAGFARAQGTAFTYQGRLNSGGSPASGSYDLTFALYNSSNPLGPVVAGPVTNTAVAVTNGLFTTVLDFGSGVFTGTNFWLGIGVRSNGGTTFTPLTPLQPLTPTPYAIFANTASNLSGTLPAAQLSGAVPSAQISGTYAGTVSFNNGANNFSGAFSGNGANLTNLNGSKLTSGTVADARLSTNVALLNGNQTFTGASTFTNLYGNSFSGSFFGNGLVGWIPTNGAAIQAQIDQGYLLTNSLLQTVTLPASPHAGDIVRISGGGAGGWFVAENAGQSILGNFASYKNTQAFGAPGSGNYQSVAASADGTRMYVVGYGVAGVNASSDSGQTFNQVGSTTISGSWYSVACSANGQIVYASPVGTGTIRYSINGGTTWSVYSGSANWGVISCTADGSTVFGGNGVVCSGNGTYRGSLVGGVISVSENAGSTWVTVPSPSANVSCLAVSSDCTRLVAGVSGGLLYASANQGATWTAITTTNQAWSGAWMSPNGGRFSATVSGTSPAGGIYNFNVGPAGGVVSTNAVISGSQGTAVELQYIGNGQFMPVSSAGTIWAN